MHFRKDTSASPNNWVPVAVVFIWIFLIGFVLYQKIQYRRTMHILTQEFSAALQQPNAHSLLTFAIYPRIVKAVGQPLVMTLPEPLIDKFFDALEDARPYARSGVTIASRDHQWFLEIAAGSTRIQMKCYIPSRQGNIVVGEFLGSKGAFQSRNLFQWYQKYSPRWLEPEKSQQSPTAQP
jgi:hypothetical protein